jgi:hypothetical protein
MPLVDIKAPGCSCVQFGICRSCFPETRLRKKRKGRRSMPAIMQLCSFGQLPGALADPGFRSCTSDKRIVQAQLKKPTIMYGARLLRYRHERPLDGFSLHCKAINSRTASLHWLDSVISKVDTALFIRCRPIRIHVGFGDLGFPVCFFKLHLTVPLLSQTRPLNTF